MNNSNDIQHGRCISCGYVCKQGTTMEGMQYGEIRQDERDGGEMKQFHWRANKSFVTINFRVQYFLGEVDIDRQITEIAQATGSMDEVRLEVMRSNGCKRWIQYRSGYDPREHESKASVIVLRRNSYRSIVLAIAAMLVSLTILFFIILNRYYPPQ